MDGSKKEDLRPHGAGGPRVLAVGDYATGVVVAVVFPLPGTAPAMGVDAIAGAAKVAAGIVQFTGLLLSVDR